MTQAAILLQLLRLPGVGPARLRLILARLFKRRVPLEGMLDLSDTQLALDARLLPEQIEALRNPPSDPTADLQHCAELGIRILLPSEPDYPFRVLALLGPKAPPLLFAKGNLDLLNLPALGISGSRRVSEASAKTVLALSSAVAERGWVVVSGGARGADEAAHLGCMKSGPGTIVVMPTGILKPNLRRDFRKHLEEGKTLLLSEFPPEYGWTAGCAMQRNRLLVALSRVMVLVEPKAAGGTGGTGRIAQKLGMPLFILQISAGASAAADSFIAAGARWLNSDQINSITLVDQFNQVYEESEAVRSRLATQPLFAT